MTDRGIIFSGVMVRALLEGRKSQTRRLATSPLARCCAGDRLWVRETFFVMADDYGWEDYVSRQGCQPDRTIGYCADRSDGPMIDQEEWSPPINAKRVVHGRRGKDDRSAWTMIGNIPSIYMPRWASRLTLLVAASRVEPLQAISAEDAIAEGVYGHVTEVGTVYSFERAGDPAGPQSMVHSPAGWEKPEHAYGALWRKLHGEASWEKNPPVVVLSFQPIARNIDRLEQP